MLRTILAVVAGLVAWGLLLALGGLIIRATWPQYVAVAEAMDFTLPMLIARLALSVVTLLIAARLTAAIAKRQISTLILGIVLVVVFIPIHVSLWEKFPLWYHLFFLLTLIPLSMLGGRIGGAAHGGRAASATPKPAGVQ